MDSSIAKTLLFLGVGIGFFFWGFMRLRRKRLIENIPTSTVRSLAMGLVELSGRAQFKGDPLTSPLTGNSCVYYQYRIERYRRSRKSGSWVTIARGDSVAVPFYLQDDTGRVLIDPRGAEIILPVDFLFETGWGDMVPANLTAFMQKHGIHYAGFFGSPRLRFREWFIRPDENIYAIGTAQKANDFIAQRNQELVSRLSDLKQNAAKMAALDLNKDGEVSLEEWDLARHGVERELLQEQLSRGHGDELADVLVTKGNTEKIFIISDQSQKDLVKDLFWQSVLGIYGGALLALVMLIVLLCELNILKF